MNNKKTQREEFTAYASWECTTCGEIVATKPSIYPPHSCPNRCRMNAWHMHDPEAPPAP
jgi:rubrerythrin